MVSADQIIRASHCQLLSACNGILLAIPHWSLVIGKPFIVMVNVHSLTTFTLKKSTQCELDLFQLCMFNVQTYTRVVVDGINYTAEMERK